MQKKSLIYQNLFNSIKIINNENNIANKIEIKYDEEIENKLNELSRIQNEKKVNEDKYWQKHLKRILMRKYRRKSLYQRMYKKKFGK